MLCFWGLVVSCEESSVWLPSQFQTLCRCLKVSWKRCRVSNCTAFVFKMRVEFLHLHSVNKTDFFSFHHCTGASSFIAGCSEYPLTHPHTHRHNERVSSSYFGRFLLNCKCCQGLWWIVVFITILLSNQAHHSRAWSSLIPAEAHSFMLIKGLLNQFIFVNF